MDPRPGESALNGGAAEWRDGIIWGAIKAGSVIHRSPPTRRINRPLLKYRPDQAKPRGTQRLTRHPLLPCFAPELMFTWTFTRLHDGPHGVPGDATAVAERLLRYASDVWRLPRGPNDARSG